ncbi:histidine kinase [Oceanobacillus sp. CAU 1775]
MKKYLSLISLILIIANILLYFIFSALVPPPEWDYWTLSLMLLLLLGSFFTALFSARGPLKVVTLVISSTGMLFLFVILIWILGIMFFGNFGT